MLATVTVAVTSLPANAGFGLVVMFVIVRSGRSGTTVTVSAALLLSSFVSETVLPESALAKPTNVPAAAYVYGTCSVVDAPPASPATGTVAATTPFTALQVTLNEPAGLTPWFVTVIETVAGFVAIGFAGLMVRLEIVRSIPLETVISFKDVLFDSFVSGTVFVGSTVAVLVKRPVRGNVNGMFTDVDAPGPSPPTATAGCGGERMFDVHWTPKASAAHVPLLATLTVTVAGCPTAGVVGFTATLLTTRSAHGVAATAARAPGPSIRASTAPRTSSGPRAYARGTLRTELLQSLTADTSRRFRPAARLPPDPGATSPLAASFAGRRIARQSIFWPGWDLYGGTETADFGRCRARTCPGASPRRPGALRR